MIITELLLAVSTPISALIIKCVKDEIDKLHIHLIERIEELEKQIGNTPKSDKPKQVTSYFCDLLFNKVAKIADAIRHKASPT